MTEVSEKNTPYIKLASNEKYRGTSNPFGLAPDLSSSDSFEIEKHEKSEGLHSRSEPENQPLVFCSSSSVEIVDDGE